MKLLPLAPATVFVILFAWLAIAHPPAVAAIDARCQNAAFSQQCPETCGASCSKATTAADFQVCAPIIGAINSGGKDQPSCRGSKGPAAGRAASVPSTGSALDEQRELCQQPAFARYCASTCIQFCQDAKGAEQMRLCGELFQISGKQPDRPSCSQQTSTFRDCQARVEDAFKSYTRRPPQEGALETVFQERPDCASPLKKLVASFVCLRDDIRLITKGIQELRSKGVGDIGADTNKLCALKPEELDYHMLLATRLITRGDTLGAEYDNQEGCRKALISWTEKLRNACAASPIQQCAELVDALADGRKKHMDYITQLSEAMRINLKQVRDERVSIEFFLNAAEDCITNKDPEDITIDDLLP